MKCSLLKCSQDIPILLFTDERELWWIQRLMNTTKELLNRKLIPADLKIKHMMQRKIEKKHLARRLSNNYVVFQIGNIIKSWTDLHIERRRKFSCHFCDEICGD